MKAKYRIMLWGGTVSCALGIGFVMQQSTPAERAFRNPPPVIVQHVVSTPKGGTDVDDYALLEVRDITLTSALPEFVEPRRLIAPAPGETRPTSLPENGRFVPAPPPDPAVPALACEVTASANVIPMARVVLSVEAPCLGNQRVTVHHSGLVFTETTAPDGRLEVTVPALEEQATFMIAFDNGIGAVARTNVEDVRAYERVAIQWSGPAGLQMHAREFGADYGEPGHVWTAASGFGEVVHLGIADTLAPKMAQVYSFPASLVNRNGTISISIEAEVTAANCARDISAQSMELRRDGELRTRELRLSMPNCDATGDFLVLNNIVEDLKIAAK